MDEDLLSPQLGALIDDAKAAAREAARGGVSSEGVAVLTDAGTVHSRGGALEAGSTDDSAARMALDSAHRSGHGRIVAAAVAVPADLAATVLPSEASRASLSEADPELPIVFKQHGRWVVLPLSQLPLRS